MIEDYGRKNYSEEFRRQAVDLYESTPDDLRDALTKITASAGAH